MTRDIRSAVSRSVAFPNNEDLPAASRSGRSKRQVSIDDQKQLRKDSSKSRNGSQESYARMMKSSQNRSREAIKEYREAMSRAHSNNSVGVSPLIERTSPLRLKNAIFQESAAPPSNFIIT